MEDGIEESRGFCVVESRRLFGVFKVRSGLLVMLASGRDRFNANISV